jgi:uncharacterized lipoprotein YajG
MINQGEKMKKILLVLVMFLVLVGCEILPPDYDVTYTVTSPDLKSAKVSIDNGMLQIRQLPFTLSSPPRAAGYLVTLQVSTDPSVTGTITGSILVNGNVAQTQTATATGSFSAGIFLFVKVQ